MPCPELLGDYVPEVLLVIGKEVALLSRHLPQHQGHTENGMEVPNCRNNQCPEGTEVSARARSAAVAPTEHWALKSTMSIIWD